MGEECIHGLDNGLCDACFPKAVPEATATATAPRTRVTRPRSVSLTAPRRPETTGTRSASRSPGSRTPGSPGSGSQGSGSLRTPVADVSEQRIYHVTHVSNLAAILDSGVLFADTNVAWTERPSVDISSADTRESRRTIVVSDDHDASVASYVPFFLTPTSSVWLNVRERAADPRLSIDIRDSVASDFVILVSSVKSVVDANTVGEDDTHAAVVVSDGDATHTMTRFSTTREAGDRALRKLRAEVEPVQVLAAEYLVRDQFPFGLISLIGVANDRARDRVKAIVKESTFKTRVAVYPPWFQRAE